MRNHIFIWHNFIIGGVQTVIYRKIKWLLENENNVYILIGTAEGGLYNQFKDLRIDIIEIGCDFIELEGSIKKLINISLDLEQKVNPEYETIIETFGPHTAILGSLIAKINKWKFFAQVCHPNDFIDGVYSQGQTFINLLKTLDQSNCLVWYGKQKINNHEKNYNYTIRNRNIIEGFGYDYLGNRKKVHNSYKKIITYIGRLCDFKIDSLIELLNDVEKIYNNVNKNIIFRVIGDGDKKQYLLEKFKLLNMYRDNKIQYLEEVKYNKLKGYIADSYVVIAGGASIIEAAIEGVPSIVSPYYCKDNSCNGFFYETPYDLELNNKSGKTYFQLIKYVLDCNDAQYHTIERKCKESAHKIYSSQVVKNQWEEYYSKIPKEIDIKYDKLLSKNELLLAKINLNISKIIKKDQKYNVLIWGTGEGGRITELEISREFNNVNILGYIDSFKKGIFNNKPIYNKETITKLNFDYVFIATSNGKMYAEQFLDSLTSDSIKYVYVLN